ncbi:MAG: transaldolase [Alphaproteobacteria bacterium]|nr:transaldolase [Alphaproteobacteria bacterium]MCB9699547.1 transaldolase [Alphaproteobacteria bacterium]
MAIWLDSADTEAVREAWLSGRIVGVTTNPAILATTGRPPLDVIVDLARSCGGTVFYQLTAETPAARRAEAERALDLAPNVGLKIPCTWENLALVSLFAKRRTVGVTAIFSASQAALAAQAGAACVLPYVNRSTRLLGDGPALVRQMRGVLEGTTTRIVAASVKTPEEAVETLLAGAHDLTLPPAVLKAMARHELSEAAIEEFARVG